MTDDTANSIADWLALHLIPGLGNAICQNLLEKFGGPREIFKAGISDLMDVEGIRAAVAQKIAQRDFTDDPEKVLHKVEEVGAKIITYGDQAYPSELREIYAPPLLLYLKGLDIPLNMTYVAVVGSRNPTPYGLKTSEEIGQGLARRGAGVVSGMARGIDAAAHWGCISGKGFTIAVLGTGIDRIYPASNKKLYHRICERGAVITEFPLGTPPEPKNFPIRNRVISGLCRGIVVVEATKQSGSLITASLALEHGREVFAVPGSINSFKSRGCHYLIKQGARLVENSDDILDELGLNFPFSTKKDAFKEAPIPPMGEEEKAIYDMLGDYPVHMDQIVRQGNREPSEVASTLLKMELRGLIRQLPGKMFVR
jgi:DNA processing protein